jgi:hypothetical protein
MCVGKTLTIPVGTTLTIIPWVLLMLI